MGITYLKESNCYRCFIYDKTIKQRIHVGDFATREEAEAVHYAAQREFDEQFKDKAHLYTTTKELSEKTGLSTQQLSYILTSHPRIKPSHGNIAYYLIEGTDKLIADFKARKERTLEQQSSQIRNTLPSLEEFKRVASEFREKSASFWG